MAQALYAPSLWGEPFAIRPAISRLLLPFSVISAAARQQARRRRATSIAVSPDTTIYVSKSGNDSNTGLSAGVPVLTLSKAFALALANGGITTIAMIGGGTWHETATYTRSGLTLDGGGTATIDGDATRSGITAANKSNCAVVDLTVTNSGTDNDDYAVTATSSASFTIDGVTVQDCPRGIWLISCTGLQIRNSLIDTITNRYGCELRTCSGGVVENVEGTAAHRVVYLNGSSNMIVRACYAHGGNAIHDYAYEEETFGTSTVPTNNLWIDNWAGASGAEIPFRYGLITKTSLNARLQRNVSFNLVQDGIGAGIYLKAAIDAQIYHNDAYDCQNGIYVGADNAPVAQSSGATIKNNIMMANIVGLSINDDSTGIVADNNLYYSNTTLAKLFGTSYATLGALQAEGYEADGLTGDPQYVTTIYGGFTLDVGSPALGAGADVGEGANLNLGHTGSTFGAA